MLHKEGRVGIALARITPSFPARTTAGSLGWPLATVMK
jgi:hypothetical protein